MVAVIGFGSAVGMYIFYCILYLYYCLLCFALPCPGLLHRIYTFWYHRRRRSKSEMPASVCRLSFTSAVDSTIFLYNLESLYFYRIYKITLFIVKNIYFEKNNIRKVCESAKKKITKFYKEKEYYKSPFFPSLKGP